jgi:hypothetical protein
MSGVRHVSGKRPEECAHRIDQPFMRGPGYGF